MLGCTAHGKLASKTIVFSKKLLCFSHLCYNYNNFEQKHI